MYVPDGHGYHTDVPVYRLTEAYEEEKSLVESLLDDLLSKWETLSGMFTMEDTVRMICEPGYVDSTMSGARAVQEKLQNKEMDSFLKSPDSLSKYMTERRLMALSEINTARILGQVMQSLCKGEKKEEKKGGGKGSKKQKGKGS